MSRVVRGLRWFFAPAAAGCAALALYALTLPPGLTWANNGADGGDFLAAALTGGVPHPTGYPTHQVLLRLSTALLGGEPARAGAWLSAICAAAAAALLADLSQRFAWRTGGSRRWSASWAGFAATLAWAASPGLWGQATIVEVYTLNALICVGLLWLSWRAVEAAEAGAPSVPWMAAAGYVLGLGLGNHLTVALIVPGLVAWFWAAGMRHRPGGAGWRAGLFGLIAGSLVYLYLPLAAGNQSPINWGDASTLPGFLWVITGRPYAGLAFGLPLRAFGPRLLGWATWTAGQFLPLGLVLALAGLWRLDHLGRRDPLVRAWWMATLITWGVYTVYAIGYNTTDSLTYLLPAFAVMALWIGEALHALLGLVERRPLLQSGLALLAIAGLALPPVATNWGRQDLSRDDEARRFLTAALAEADPNAVILTAGDARTFALWYGVYGLRRRADVAVVNVNLYGYDWYRRSLAKTHPDLVSFLDAAPPIGSLVDALKAERPVYAAENLGPTILTAAGQTEGVLTRLTSR